MQMKSISRWWYNFNSRGYLDPTRQPFVDAEGLELILEGKLKNPHRTTASGFATEYGFFVMPVSSYYGSTVAVVPRGRLRFDTHHAVATESADWFGYVQCESSTSFVFPKKNEEILFDPRRKQLIHSNLSQSVWQGGGRYQLDKRVGNIVLLTTLNANQAYAQISDFFN